MQRIARIGWMAALALANAAVLAVDGEYDADWANGGRLAIDVSPDSDAAEALLIQADGKLVLAGDWTITGGGTMPPEFAPPGVGEAAVQLAGSFPYALATRR